MGRSQTRFGGQSRSTRAKVSVVVVDVSTVPDARALHGLLSDKLGFPSYYGMNWDAFNDCFGESDSAPLPETLRIVGWARFEERLPNEAALFRECLNRLGPAHPGCQVEWAG